MICVFLSFNFLYFIINKEYAFSVVAIIILKTNETMSVTIDTCERVSAEG